MEFKIEDPLKIEIFTSIFQNIKYLTENICIHFTNDHMYVQTMDSSKISILEINIPHSWFDYYHYGGDNNEDANNSLKISLNSIILHKILSCREKNQTIHVQYNTDGLNEDKLYVNMISDMVIDEELTGIKPFQTYSRFFEIPLIDYDEDLMTIPNIDYEAEILLPSFHFATLIHQLKGFGDVLDIECNDKNIQFISKSNESGSMRVEVLMDELGGFSIIEDETITASFALQYLNIICAYSKLSKNVELKIHRNNPIQIEYLFGNNSSTYIKYFLAPKITDY
jgi:proliferating cell nuclear antigen